MSEKSARRAELEAIKNFVDGTYNNYGNRLYVDNEKPYDPGHTELGYCFKHVDDTSGHVIYSIVCSPTGVEEADFRIMMHEYGHIYLGHLDGIHEELDTQVCNVFRDYRPELIERINKSCGIDFADKLIERVIDDPEMNHAIHNIAEDFSVNTTVLNPSDIEIMERGVDSILPQNDRELMEYLAKNCADPSEKASYQEALDRMKKETKIKFMLPGRYFLGPKLDMYGNPIPIVDENGNPVLLDDGTPAFEQEPFPDGLSYPEYLIMIIEHLDQFVKMMVSITMGGDGDTSKVSQQDIQNALQNAYNNWQEKSDEYKKGYNDAINDYKNGKLGQKQNAPQQNQQGQSGQDGQGQRQSGQDGNQSGQQDSGQGQSGQGQPGGQSQGGGQQGSGQDGSSQGQSGQGQSGNGGGKGTYEDGYNDALRDIANSQGQGGGSGMQSLSDLMNSTGMSQQGSGQDGQGQDGSGQGQNGSGQQGQQNGAGGGQGRQGTRPPQIPDADAGQDHRTDARDDADNLRRVGKIHSGGGTGCGDSGGADCIRTLNKDADEVDMALKEVLSNMKNRVVKTAVKKDQMKLFNRGVNRSTIVPSRSTKVTICNDPTIVFLIDISGSMDTNLIDRILVTINSSLYKLSRGLKYNIITWSTRLGEHIKDIDPRKGIPEIRSGGGTRLAEGIRYFKEHYDENAILIVISDFEDYLNEWHEVEKTMPKYAMYGFNYGCGGWGSDSDSIDWSYMKIRKFNSR